MRQGPPSGRLLALFSCSPAVQRRLANQVSMASRGRAVARWSLYLTYSSGKGATAKTASRYFWTS